MRHAALIAIVLAACSKEGSKQSAVAGDTCVEGRKVIERRWGDSGLTTTIMSCTKGTPMHVLSDQKGTEIKETLSRSAWDRLWKDLETANWRKLSSACAPEPDGLKDPALQKRAHQRLGVEITDGRTTKTFVCIVSKLTDQQGSITKALANATFSERPI